MPTKKFLPLPRHIREPIVYLLGGVIRELREKQGLTPAALAKRSGIRRQGLILIESNQRLARAETVERVGRALGILGIALMAIAERRASRLPASCFKCNYCCFAGGRLKWLNSSRGCIRPAR
jgi:transcriptional regulator with XRE-family HTH domain